VSSDKEEQEHVFNARCVRFNLHTCNNLLKEQTRERHRLVSDEMVARECWLLEREEHRTNPCSPVIAGSANVEACVASSVQ
jgi:hypothetical protein